jgi:hypothetical protein
MSKYLFLTVICLLVIFMPIFGQQTETDRARQERDRIQQERRNLERESVLNKQAVEQQESLETWRRQTERNIRRRSNSENRPMTKEDRERLKAVRLPNSEDLAKYKNFLQQKNTGLFRLFPNFNCEEKNILRVDGDCAHVVLGSWNYSFRQKDYSGANLWDIEYKDGNLISQGFLSQGMMVRLGDVALENVLPAENGVKFLLDFKPGIQSEEAKKQFLRINSGIAADGYKYANSLKAETNVTYALRMVAYRNENKTTNRWIPESVNPDYVKFLSLEYDKRIDLTVAFRIVRQDENGSLTILWKELNRQASPKLVFAKNEKLTDIKPKS